MGFTLEALFIQALNLSISAGWMIAAIIVLRVLLRKTPKRIMCLLWILVGIRLITPVIPESRISLVPSAETVPETIMLSDNPAIESGITAVDTALNPIIAGAAAPKIEASVNPMQVIMYIASRIWAAGIAVMMFYLVWTWLRIKGKMRTATLMHGDGLHCGNVFQSEFADSPFILGIIRARIYVPYGMGGDELASVLAHERAHIMRRDNWLKPAAFIVLSVYWFNPMVWTAYVLLCRDVEFACDEYVIRDMDSEQRKKYSVALLNCTGKRRIAAASPLAFGELGIKQRILRIKDYRKSAPLVIITTVIICCITAVCFMSNPKSDKEDNAQTAHIPWNEESVQHEEDAVSGEDVPRDAVQEEAVQTQVFLSPEDAINNAILERFEDSAELTEAASVKYPTEASLEEDDLLQRISCCSFVELDCISEYEESGSYNVTYYGWALYQRYRVLDVGIEEISGSHTPVALTFEVGENGYVLKKYWEPGVGSQYIEDIKSEFPLHCVDDALDSQKYAVSQKQSCYEQAVKAMNIDTAKAIEHLLEVICGEPEPSSNPWDYIDAHYAEFLELIFYNKYTVDYYMQNYNDSGDNTLGGQVLLRAIREIQTDDVVIGSEEEEPLFVPLIY